MKIVAYCESWYLGTGYVLRFSFLGQLFSGLFRFGNEIEVDKRVKVLYHTCKQNQKCCYLSSRDD